jgi:hypothetical protein
MIVTLVLSKAHNLDNKKMSDSNKQSFPVQNKYSTASVDPAALLQTSNLTDIQNSNIIYML